MEMTDKTTNPIVLSTKKYLEEAGVHASGDLSAFRAEKGSYVKIDDAIVAKVDAALQSVPQIMLNKLYSGDVYHVIYDKGLGVLQKSAQHPGEYLGNVVSADANNKIKGVARLRKLDIGAQIAGNVFTAMSLVTRQYFMSQINNRLHKIEGCVMEIRKFLEDDKRSKLQSEEEFLKMTQQTMPFIVENEAQKQATLTSIQKIRMDALADIIFYRKQINSPERISAKKDKSDEVIKNVNDICSLMSEYWYSLYLYCFAVYLEPIVARNYDSDYLNLLIEELLERCRCYKKDFVLWKQKLEDYVESAVAFQDNKLLSGLNNYLNGNKYLIGVQAPYYSGGTLLQVLINMAVDVTDNLDKNYKRTQKEKAKNSLSVSMWENIEIMEEKRMVLQQIDLSHNKRFEVVRDHDGMYIRV